MAHNIIHLGQTFSCLVPASLDPAFHGEQITVKAPEPNVSAMSASVSLAGCAMDVKKGGVRERKCFHVLFNWACLRRGEKVRVQWRIFQLEAEEFGSTVLVFSFD